MITRRRAALDAIAVTVVTLLAFVLLAATFGERASSPASKPVCPPSMTTESAK